MATVFLNGEYVARDRARVSVDDRGFVFGDGVYEVTPVYHGQPLDLIRRLDRLRFGLGELGIAYDVGSVEGIYRELLSRNGLTEEPMAMVYFQVTRGSAERTHTFPPPGTPPTVYGYARAYRRPTRSEWSTGATAITVPDPRWGRVDVKTLQLLPNVLAQEAARRAGVDEAIFVKDGLALEGARNNLFLVVDGTLRTHPTSNQILPGITRALILDLAGERGYEVEERPTSVDDLERASEVFLTGSTTEVRPIVRIDDKPVGTGDVGPVATELYGVFVDRINDGAGSLPGSPSGEGIASRPPVPSS